jgi:hypothetical protein
MVDRQGDIFLPKRRLRAGVPDRHRFGPAARMILAVLGLGFFALEFPGAARGADEGTVDYYHDFRSRPLPAELTFFNAEDGKFFQSEPEGLRITLPKTWIHPWGGVGFRTSFGFVGDFEVTATVEVLQAETPPAGYGVGVALYVAKPGGGATIGRMLRAGNNQVILWDVTNPPNEIGEVPCSDNVVRLRLKRTGTILHYLWAPGTEGGDFQEIQQVEFGSAEIDWVRLSALTGRMPCAADVRLLDLRIRSQKPDTPLADMLGARWKVWLALAIVVAVSLGMRVAMRRSRRAGKVPAHPSLSHGQPEG